MLLEMAVSFLFLLFSCLQGPIQAAKLINVSPTGRDDVNCGAASVPCASLGYTVRHRSDMNDTIIINGRNRTSPARYVEEMFDPIHINYKLTIKGTNGRPTLAFKGNSALFSITRTEKPAMFSTVQFINIDFQAVGKTKVILSVQDATLECFQCRFRGASNGIEFSWRVPSQLSVIESSFEGVKKGIILRNGFAFTNIEIRNCSFIGIKGNSLAAMQLENLYHSYPYPLTYIDVKIKDTIFTNFSLGIDFGIDKLYLFELKIEGCQFRHQTKGAVSMKTGKGERKLNIRIDKTVFYENVADSGAALYIFSGLSTTVNITRCEFEGNKANATGGAIAAIGRISLSIDRCTFNRNDCSYGRGLSIEYGRGAGGAIGIYSRHDYVITATINRSLFTGNTAESYGGTIYANAGCKESFVKLIDSDIASPTTKLYRATVGDAIYSSASMKISNVRVRVKKPLSGKSILQFSDKPVKVDVNTRIICSEGFRLQMAATSVTNNDPSGDHPNRMLSVEKYRTFSIGCIMCQYDHYSLIGGVFRNLTPVNAKCNKCPIGGECREGRLTAKSNFWGFKYGRNGSVKFVRLHDGYGCTGSECIDYWSCTANRTGPLCARCSTGYSETFLSPKCIKNEHCQNGIFWITACLLLLLYTSILLLKKDLFELIKREVLWFTKRQVIQEDQPWLRTGQLTMDDVVTDNDAMDDGVMDYVYVQHVGEGGNQQDDNEVIQMRQNNCNGQSGLGQGLLKIFFYFYQIESILNLNETQIKAGVLKQMKNYASSFFSFKFSSKQSSFSCFKENTTPVEKLLIRIGLVGAIFTIFLLLYIAEVSIRKLLCRSRATTRFGDRVLTSVFEAFLLCYAVVIHVAFNLLKCIEIGNDSVLYIQGDVECQRPWHNTLMLVVFAWVLPFCVFVFALPRLLLRRRIRTWHLFAGCIFPLPYLLTVYLQKLHAKITTKKETDEDNGEKEENGVLNAVKEIVTGAFRKEDDSAEFIWWESVLIFRRLVLTAAVTFIQSLYAKFYTIFLIQLVFLLHHVHSQPYNRRILNVIETISLTFLMVIGSMNFLDKFEYSQVDNDLENGKNLQEIFAWIQLIVSSLVPAVVCIVILVIFVLAIFRVLHALFRYVLSRYAMSRRSAVEHW